MSRYLTVVPGSGFAGLTDATACLYVLEDDGKIAQVLLATEPGQSLEEVTEFFCQQIFLATRPDFADDEEFRSLKPATSPVVVKLAVEGLTEEASLFVRKGISSLFGSATWVGWSDE